MEKKEETKFTIALGKWVEENGLDSIFQFMEDYKEIADAENSWEERTEVREFSAMFAYEAGNFKLLMPELIWIIGHWELHPHEKELSGSMKCVELYVEEMTNFPEVSIEQIEMVLDTLQRWLKTENHGVQRYHWAAFCTYLKMGRLDIAEKHKAVLLDLEQQQPFPELFKEFSCKKCSTVKIMKYNLLMGKTDEVIQTGKALRGSEMHTPCMSAPRGGLAYLLEAMVGAGRAHEEEAEFAIGQLIFSRNFPLKAPLRIVVPMIEYYVAVEKFDDAASYIRQYLQVAETTSELWYARKFYEAANKLPEFAQHNFNERIETIQACLQR